MTLTNPWRRKRRLSLEKLETRQLMAAEASATFSSGTINIQGSDFNDSITVVHDPNANTIRVRNFGRDLLSRPVVGPISGITANLRGGTDSISISSTGTLRVPVLRIDMGNGPASGVREAVVLSRVQATDVAIRGFSPIGVNVQVATSTVQRLNVQTGSGNDSLTIRSGSWVRRLEANLAGGNDTLTVGGGRGAFTGRSFYNQVDRAFGDLGSGTNSIHVWNNASILSQSIRNPGRTNS